jgi:hypothetical protein
MKKETAVEWLVTELKKTDMGKNLLEQTYNKTLMNKAKEMEKEQLEKELNAFFLFIRNSGEHFIGMPIEQFVKSYLENK